MRVLHVIPSLHPSQGGPSTVMPQIAKALSDQGLTVDVACVDQFSATNKQGVVIEQAPGGYRVLNFRPQIVRRRLSFTFMRWLERNASRYDLIHVHGVLNFPCLAADWAAIRHGVPLVVRPLGILNRWGMENRKAVLKKIWFRCLEKPLLDRAAALHFTSQEEKDDVARLRIKAPTEVLPLGLDMSPFESMPQRGIFRDRLGVSSSEKMVLFLSRIHPKKGLEVLLHAFALVHRDLKDVTLVIAGDGQKNYLAELHALVAELGIGEKVLWTGFLNPTERLQALAASDVFCLPSNSENFGIALLEAMASGLPCISSPEVALAQESPTQGAVKVVPRDPELWAEAMKSLIANPGLARELGTRAVSVCKEHYSTEKMGVNLVSLYKRLIGLKEGRAEDGEAQSAAAQSSRMQNAGGSSAARIPLGDVTPVILTWNEEPNLSRCLERLQWASQVIVLDSGSTDATVSIASGYPNVRVVQRPFDDHTSQWNFGVGQSGTDWILALDADYVPAGGFEDEIAALRLESGVNAFEAAFNYCIEGRPLKASLYPPRAVLFNRKYCKYVQDGHTQLLSVEGRTKRLATRIHHDDRKPLSRWIQSQDNYARLEAEKLLAMPAASLRLQDRLRRTGWAAIPATLIYTLLVKGTILDGWRGWFYSLQRTFAEMLLAMRLVEKRLARK